MEELRAEIEYRLNRFPFYLFGKRMPHYVCRSFKKLSVPVCTVLRWQLSAAGLLLRLVLPSLPKAAVVLGEQCAGGWEVWMA